METATSDEQIVQRALTGDADAFGEIVRRWERRIFALAFGMLVPMFGIGVAGLWGAIYGKYPTRPDESASVPGDE